MTALSSYARVLVTGATGFLGSHLVRELRGRGVEVRALGRNLDRGHELARIGAEFRAVDLTDRASVIESCRGMSAVVHAGALSSAWGTWEDFHAANVRGTEHVLEGCETHGVDRLVHISSPSVTSRMTDQFGLTEDEPFPTEFVSLYSESKKLGEDRVRAASKRGLRAVILRPKAIYGEGDTAIFPRIVEAGRKGRLPRIGDGRAVTNLTHVSDVCSGIFAALESDVAIGRTYVLTGGEDVRMWDVIFRIFRDLGIAEPRRNLDVVRALRVAETLERLWRTLRLPGEPPLTHYKVGVLSYSQTYDISAARRDLGYEPRVRIDDGIREVVASAIRSQQNGEHRSEPRIEPVRRSEVKAPPRVDVRYFNAGVVHAPEMLFVPGGALRSMRVPSLFAVIRHPRHGVVLFDTGYSERFQTSTEKLPERLYRWATPVDIGPRDTAVAQLAASGVHPEEVRTIVLSHFDPDHYGGLRDFPNATIVCGSRAWASVAGKQGLAALRMRLLPGHLPDDMTARTELVGGFEGPGIASFEASHDLFDDGTIRLVELEGHAPGQVGAFLTTQTGETHFLAADAVWSRASIDYSPIVPVHRFIARDRRAQDETTARIRALRSSVPNLVIVPSHCPDAARELAGWTA